MILKSKVLKMRLISKIESFRNAPLMERDLDPLIWWKTNYSIYRFLTKLMFKYFSIPATSTEAERVFSALGNLLTKKRLSMIGENVDKQLFLRDKFSKSQ